MSKKILVVCQRFWPEKQKINDICRGFLERGYKVDVLCGHPNYPEGSFYKGYSATSPKYEKGPGMNIYRAVELKRGAGSNINIFLNYLSFSLLSRLTALQLKRNSYDRIFIYQLSPVSMAAPGFAVARRLKKPVTLYAIDIWPDSAIRELDIQSGLLRKILSAISAKYYRNADNVICATKKSSEYMTGVLKIPAKRVSVVPLCPEYGSREEIKDDNMLEKYAGSFNIVFTGRVSEEQDLETVIRAACELQNMGVRDVKIIIGGAGNAIPKMMAHVNENHLQDIVFFERTNKTEDYLKLSYIADAMLSCRKPQTIGDYYCPEEFTDILAAGKPVITTMSSEGRDIIHKTGCGYIYEAGNPDSLKDIILKLSRTPREKLLEMGRKALEYQQENLDREANIDKLLEVIFREPDPLLLMPDEDDEEITVLKGSADSDKE